MKYLWLVLSVLCSAGAQVLMKRAGLCGLGTLPWQALTAASALSYLAAFALYGALLRTMPLSVASPTTMVGGMALVTTAGFAMGERVSAQKVVGLALGVAAVLILLSDRR